MNPLLHRVRQLWRPTLRDQLEQQTRDTLRRYDGRPAPDLRVFVSLDLLPTGASEAVWSSDEERRLHAFAQRWADDNGVDWTGRGIEIVVLDTAERIAWVKPVQLAARPAVERAEAELTFVDDARPPLRVRGEVVLGREGAPGETFVQIDDPKVSRRHLRLRLTGHALMATDLASRTGTRVNDRPLGASEERRLAVGDVVQLGTTRLRVTRTP